jgi:hypothetical protein
MKGNQEAIAGLDKLIEAARARLAANPDYIALKALEKARAEIMGVRGALPTIAPLVTIIDSSRDGGTAALKRISQLGAAAVVLDKVGHPVPADELMQGAIAEGAEITSTKPLASFGSSLSKSDKFRSVRWHGDYAWWFSDRPVPGNQTRRQAREAAEAAE